MGGKGALSESCTGQNRWVDDERKAENKNVLHEFIYMLEER